MKFVAILRLSCFELSKSHQFGIQILQENTLQHLSPIGGVDIDSVQQYYV